MRYYRVVMRSFRDKDTELVFNRLPARRFTSDILRAARRKLLILNAAERLVDLRILPSNRLERLSGGREGQHSIRINGRWRICFRWCDADAYDVEIVDYH